MNNADMTFENTPPDFSLIDDLLRLKKLSFEEVGLYFLLFGISNKSIVFDNITDLAKLANCGIDKLKGLLNKLIEKKLLLKYRKTKWIYFFKVLMPDEDYETVKKGFLK